MPTGSTIYGTDECSSLSDVIVGQAKFSAVVTQVMAKPDALSAGYPPNPMALDSNRMAGLIEIFCKNKDFVIDAPPFGTGG